MKRRIYIYTKFFHSKKKVLCQTCKYHFEETKENLNKRVVYTRKHDEGKSFPIMTDFLSLQQSITSGLRNDRFKSLLYK